MQKIKWGMLLLSAFMFACGGGGGGTGGGSAAGGSSGTGGGHTGGGSASMGGGTESMGGGSASTGGGSESIGGGTAATGGGSGATGGGAGVGGGSSGGITVNGHVLSLQGVAVAGATVVIIGKGNTTTDSSGAFTFSNVTTPYDLATTAGNGNFITLVRQITRNDPTITSFATGIGTGKTATVTGTFAGGAVPSLAREDNYMFESPETTNTATMNAADGGYSVSVGWYGPVTTTGTVHALQLSRSLTTNLPTNYQSYGNVGNVVLADMNTAMNKNIAGSGVTAQLFSGTLTVPTAATYLNVATKSISLRIGNGSMPLGTDSTTSTSFSFQAPQVASSTITFTASASGMSRASQFTRYGLASNSTGVAITFATPPTLSIPATGAMGINLASQSFSWAPMDPTGLYQVIMTVGTKAFVIYTTDTSFVLPSTTELGLGTFSTGTSGNWRVSGIGGGPVTTNDIVGPTGSKLAPPATGDSWLGQSEARSFQTQ